MNTKLEEMLRLIGAGDSINISIPIDVELLEDMLMGNQVVVDIGHMSFKIRRDFIDETVEKDKQMDIEVEHKPAVDTVSEPVCSTFLPFEDARKIVRSLGLKGWFEWKAYSKSGKRPSNIPSHPEKIYADKWVSGYDWMGYDAKSRCKHSNRHKASRNTDIFKGIVEDLRIGNSDIDVAKKYGVSKATVAAIRYRWICGKYPDLGKWPGIDTRKTSKIVDSRAVANNPKTGRQISTIAVGKSLKKGETRNGVALIQYLINKNGKVDFDVFTSSLESEGYSGKRLDNTRYRAWSKAKQIGFKEILTSKTVDGKSKHVKSLVC